MPLWLPADPLLLASTSATRRLLLESAGLPVETEAPGVDERAVEAGAGALPPEGIARRLAGEKALAVSRRRPGRVVVGADQVLALEGEVLHKPADRAAAHAQIMRLAGRTHALHTAFAIALDGAVRREGLDSARLTMRPLGAAAIERYLALAGDAVTQSVGGYQLEGAGIHLFERVEGDHATILGLPLLPLLAGLRGMGLLAF
ncbi:MAG TPA: Maf family protein [Beijerinckiaceae bacterium]|jgi:septum formation protein